MSLPTILCPVDFSEHSRHALRRAAALARHHQSRVVVLNAVHPLLAEAARVRLGLDLVTTEVEPALREFVRTTWRDETRSADVDVQVRVGDSADVILGAAAAVDLVVMGTHGLGGVRKWLLGSTTQRVLRRTRTAILAVPAVAAAASGSAMPEAGAAPGKGPILAASDLSEASVHAMRWAARLATQYDVPLLLAHVVEPVVVAPQWRPYVQETDEGRLASARERLQRLAEQICPGSCETIVSLGRPDEAIASVAAERTVGLIVVGLGGGPGLLERRPGSVAYRVLTLATSPVLVVPAEAPLPT